MKKIKKNITENKGPIYCLKESKNSIKIIILIFILSTLLGFLNAKRLFFLNDVLKDIIEQAQDLSGLNLIIFIFINNSLSSILGLILGIFLGIFPIIITVTNGLVLGYVMNITINKFGFIELWRLLPHGIIELSAVFISLGLGLKIGTDVIKIYIKVHKNNSLMKVLGALSLFLGLIGISVIRLAFNLALDAQSLMPKYLLSVIIAILGIIALLPFFILFLYNDKKMRSFILKRLDNSIKVFINIVMPLLIIAAIIEGLLITLI